MDFDLIPKEVVKAITGTTDNTVAKQQGCAIVGMLQNYLGLVLKKQDIADEKVTMPYKFSRCIPTHYAPINSVTSVSLITSTGEYRPLQGHLSVGRFSVEVLPEFWACMHYYILPSAVSAIKISYNVGLYSSWEEVPAILQEAAQELLKFKYDADYTAGFQSEHFGDYSYTKGSFVKGLPAEIAGMLEGIEL